MFLLICAIFSLFQYIVGLFVDLWFSFWSLQSNTMCSINGCSSMQSKKQLSFERQLFAKRFRNWRHALDFHKINSWWCKTFFSITIFCFSPTYIVRTFVERICNSDIHCFRDGQEIGVVYKRSTYIPEHFESEKVSKYCTPHNSRPHCFLHWYFGFVGLGNVTFNRAIASDKVSVRELPPGRCQENTTGLRLTQLEAANLPLWLYPLS